MKVVAVVVFLAGSAWALDKQGSAHAGAVESGGNDFNVSGALMAGFSLYNPSYAARPDNTGLTLMRYAAHLDLDLVGRLLSIPLDLNYFSDGTRRGLERFTPSEFDVITGLTSTFNAGPGALELGVRLEHDQPVDSFGFRQLYVDVRARYLFSLATVFPRLAEVLRDGDVNGWVTLGAFAINPSYAARPDNTGRALLRYAAHVEVSTFSDLLSVGLDTTLFTDGRTNAVAPSELDLTLELIFHKEPWEVHLAWETDQPVDRPGLTQQFVYLVAVWSFDVSQPLTRPLETRSTFASP